MTPEEKAKELVDKFDLPSGLMSIERKQCALIAVDEILKELNCAYNGADITTNEHKEYWQQVKQEIQSL